MWFLQYEVRPTPQHRRFQDIGGAIVDCFILAASAEVATDQSSSAVREERWELVSVEKGAQIVNRTEFDANAIYLQAFDLAMAEGECYLYRSWPKAPEPGNPIH